MKSLWWVVIAGCWSGPPQVARPATPSFDPVAVATRLLDREIEAAKQADSKALHELFAPTAKLWNATDEYDAATMTALPVFGLPAGASTNILDVKLGTVHAGGSETAVWFTAHVTVTFTAPGDAVGTSELRMTQLATAGRVVAAVTAEPGELRDARLRSFDDAAPGGALAALVKSPAGLAGALAPSAIVVIESGKVLAGDGARRAIATRTYTLGDVRETRTARWGFVAAKVSGGLAFVVATPHPTGWSVDLVHLLPD